MSHTLLFDAWKPIKIPILTLVSTCYWLRYSTHWCTIFNIIPL